jgi:leucyl aminopeptidase (aminopeptidase T)
MDNQYNTIIKNILDNFVKLKYKEKVLLVNDHKDNTVFDAFKFVLSQRNIFFKEVLITENRNNSSPIPEIREDLLWADVIIAPTNKSITHSLETIEAVKLGKRIVTLPGITEEVFLKIANSNFDEMWKINKKLILYLKEKDIINIKTPHGTDINFSIKERSWDGLQPDTSKGFARNLPTGEVYCAPIEETANGKIVFDYWGDKISPRDNAWIEIKDGKIVKWSKSAEQFIKQHSVENGLITAEFGIGTNKAHRFPIGNILHDEKIYGTVHIAFGNNVSFGGKNKSPVHSDIILVNPRVLVDGKRLDW